MKKILHYIALYYGGTSPKLQCESKSYAVEPLNDFEAPTGSFVAARLIFDSAEKHYMLVYVDTKPLLVKFDLNKIPIQISKSRLAFYHGSCLKNENVPIEDQDRELFIVKLNWYDKTNQNTTFHLRMPAYFDKRQETARIALGHELSNFYALAYQSGITSNYNALITPVRFFTCINEVVSFLREFKISYEDLKQSEISYIRNHL